MEYCEDCAQNHLVRFPPVESAHVPHPINEKCNCKCHKK